MNETLIKELETAVLMLGRITVAGDAVDFMAAAKQKIRTVAAELKAAELKAAEPKKEETADG